MYGNFIFFSFCKSWLNDLYITFIKYNNILITKSSILGYGSTILFINYINCLYITSLDWKFSAEGTSCHSNDVKDMAILIMPNVLDELVLH